MITSEESVVDLAESLKSIEAKWKFFAMLGYETHHPEVDRFHNSKARIKVACAPSRSTKSYASAHDIMPVVLTPNTINWIVGPSYGLAEKEFRILHEKLVINRDRIGLPKPTICVNNPRSGSLYIKFKWGSILECKSADRPDSLLGEAIDSVIYSEGAQLPRAIRERYVMQRVITRKGREIIPTTPAEAAEWVKELWDWGNEGRDPEIEAFHWDVTANPTYNMEDLERAKRLYGAESPMFREQFLGEWVFYAGRVYPTFQKETHVIEPFDIPASWRRVRAIDFGHRDPFVCLWAAIGPEGELYFYREYYCREGRSIREHAQYIKGFSLNENIFDTVGDPSAAQAIEDLNEEGVGVDRANNDRTAGRMRVLEYLMPTENGVVPFHYKGTPKANERKKWANMYIFDNCKETIREFMHFRWKEKQAKEGDKERTEGEDHAMDTVRYLCMTRPSPLREKRAAEYGTFNWYKKRMRGMPTSLIGV